MDLKVRSTSYKGSDKSWLASAHGVENARTVTISVSTFTKATHFPNGYLPSGMCLGIITASSKYGLYDNAALDGRTVLRGHLLEDVVIDSDNESGDVIGALFWHGGVREARLPTNSGIDANGKTDVAGFIKYF